MMVNFLWEEKKVKVNFIQMVYYIKKVVGIMIFYKVMLNNIIQMDKFNLKVNLKMVNPMDFVKNFFKMDN